MAIRKNRAAFHVVLVLAILTGCKHPSTPEPDPQPPTPTAIWTTKAAIPTARYGAAAALVGSKIYVIGGMIGDGSISTAVEAYDTITDAWTSLSASDPLPLGLFEASAAAYSGKLYVFGGRDNSQVYDRIYCFDPSQASGSRWILLGPTLSGNRFGAAVAISNGVAYLCGGDTGVGTTTSVDRIDLRTNPVVVTADEAMPTARSLHVAAANGGIIYTLMGSEASYVNTVKRFDPAEAMGSRWSSAGTTTPRALNEAAADVASGKAYLFSGRDNVSTNGSTYTQVFDPAGPSAVEKTAMPSARFGACALSAYGAIYVIGGASSADGSSVLSVVEQYYPPLD